MASLTCDIHIDADPKTVFNAFSDLELAERVIDGIDDITVLSGPAKMEVGTTWRETRTMFGKEATEDMQVVEITEPSTYVVTAASHGTEYRSTYTFTPTHGGTTVALEFVGTPVTFGAKAMSIMGVLFQGTVKKMMLADMQDMKEHIEANASVN